MPIQVIIEADAVSAGQRAAREIESLVRQNPACVLGLATGGTPVECYRELVRLHREQGLDFSKVTTFNLDEYTCLSGDHPQSFRYFMQKQLFEHINVPADATHVPSGVECDLSFEAMNYEREIKLHGGIDLQLLGIGHNGHIAFNEPGTPRDSRTRVVSLTNETVQANARFFDSPADVPHTAITMGIRTILEAKRILLIATGAGKRAAVKRALDGEISEDCPASFLQSHHNVTFILDEAAAPGRLSEPKP